MFLLSSFPFSPEADAGIQTYNPSKAALNALTAYHTLTFPKKPHRFVCLCPGYNSTAINGYSGSMPPDYGARIIVRAAVEGPESEMKTGGFWNEKGERVAW